MNNDIKITTIQEKPELIERAAKWFSSIWGVPLEAYLESMNDSLTTTNGVPAWYVVMDNDGEVIAGVGVIENDFHKRKDLRPNICALYVSKDYRKQGIARKLVDNACKRLADHGVENAYLLSSHTEFYEKLDWTFYGMIEEDGGELCRTYVRSLA